MHPLLCLLLLATAVLPASAKETRHHLGVELFINNTPAGKTNGCTTRPLPVRGEARCGHAPHISEVRWKYLSSTEKGDIYLFLRRFPADAAEAKQESKVVEFTGKELILWEDSHQRILLRRGE